MKRRHFMKLIGLLAALPATQVMPGVSSVTKAGKKQIYEWRFYTLEKESADLDRFFQEVLIPAYNRQKVTVGAFAPYKKGEKDQRVLLFVYPDMPAYQRVKREIWKDERFRREAQPFYDRSAPDPVYFNFETSLCEAFDLLPRMKKSENGCTLFEIRQYHSPNEEANRRKVNMFNKDEIAVFDKVGLPYLCFGEVFAGPSMPSLIYLIGYRNEEVRNEIWRKFGAHPDWKRIKDLPEYAYTATRNTSMFFSPMPYSQV